MYVFQFAVGSGVGVGDETAAGEKVGVGVTFLPVTKVPTKYATAARIATPRRTWASLTRNNDCFGSSGGIGTAGVLGELSGTTTSGEPKLTPEESV